MNVADKWIIGKNLGQGGSGDVKECSVDKNSKKYAIKQLRNQKSGRKERFEIEIKTNLDLKGKEDMYKTMPMIDYDQHKYSWYVSIIGEHSLNYIKNKKIEPLKILFLYKEFLKGIKELHKAKIFHRDIKADNILFYKDSFRIIDFGIASNDKLNLYHDITKSYDKNQLGAKFTMAPEMRRNPATADPLKADIYSLAKTLWSLITQDIQCFDGQYNTNNHSLYDYFKDFESTHDLSTLDYILYKCTDDNPEKRSNIDEFIEVLDNITWSNSHSNNGLGKNLYLSRTHSLENLNKYIPNFSHFNSVDLNTDFLYVICELVNSGTFIFTQNSFKNIKDISSMKIINNEHFIIGDDKIFSDYLNIEYIENIFLVNESNIPFLIFIKMTNDYIILMCDNEKSNDYLYMKLYMNKNLYIPEFYLTDILSLKKYLYEEIKKD